MHFVVDVATDPFVDDSDEIAQVTAELKKRKLKTVHGGFFVSSGELEVLKDQEQSRTSNSERSDADGALSNISSDFILKDIKVPLKLKLVKSKGGQSSKDTQSSASSSLKSPVSEGSTSVRIRSIKTKPLWTPSLASLAALETFKQAFLNMNITMGKSGIVPSQVGSAASLCDTSPFLYADPLMLRLSLSLQRLLDVNLNNSIPVSN